MSELLLLRIEGIIAIVATLLACGHAAYVFQRANTRLTTYAACVNVLAMIEAAVLTWISFDVHGLRNTFPHTIDSYTIRAIPITMALLTAFFMDGLGDRAHRGD